MCFSVVLTIAEVKKKYPTRTPLLHSRCLLVRCQRESVRVHRKHRAVHTRIPKILLNKTYRFLSVWAILLDTYNIFWSRDRFVGAIWQFGQRRRMNIKCHININSCVVWYNLHGTLFGSFYAVVQLFILPIRFGWANEIFVLFQSKIVFLMKIINYMIYFTNEIRKIEF